MGDYLVRALAFNKTVRAVAIDLTETVRVAQEKHESNPTASAAMGRLMTAAAVMGSTLKDKQKLTLQVKGDGPLGSINAQIDDKGNVRGYVQNPHILVEPFSEDKLAVSRGVGQNGMLYVTKDLGVKEPYKGSVQLVSGEIAEDIAYYFVISEQTPTVFAAGVLVGEEGKIKSAGGYLIQLMPDAKDSVIDELEKIVNSSESVSRLLDRGMTPEDILEYLLQNHELQFLDEKQYFRFSCSCSKDTLTGALITLGNEDLETFLDQDKTEVCCQYCSECYDFSKTEIEEIINAIKNQDDKNETN
jgi:molecular chaperone Hsp33